MEPTSAFLVGPGERGVELVYPVAVFSEFADAEAYIKEQWDVSLEPHEGTFGTDRNVWSGRREKDNPVDLIFVYEVPMLP